MQTDMNSWLLQTLQQESTMKYFIQFDHFKANHMASGIIALFKLGASESRIKQFIKWYGPTIEPPDHDNHKGEDPNVPPVSESELTHLLGKRTNYYGILNQFKLKSQKYASIDLFIEKEFGKLSRGIGCAAIHGLIHVGYGYHVGSPILVSEGIAFLHHSYVPLLFDLTNEENKITNFGKGSENILDVLREMASNDLLRQKMLDGANQLSNSEWSHSSPFQYRFASLMQNGDELIKYANRIKVPCYGNGETISRISNWLLDQAIAVYVMSERPNDFFLLHGVTSAWALRQIIPVLKQSDALDTLRTFTCVLLAAYMIQDCPQLTNKINAGNKPIDADTWEDMIRQTLSYDRDEHVYKLVQVCYDLWRENRNTDEAALYVEAAKSCINNSLAFLTYQMKGEVK